MEYFWKTKEGKVINVNDMDENHLRNALKMIIRQQHNQKQKPKPKVNFKLNGDMAQVFNDDMELDEYGD